MVRASVRRLKSYVKAILSRTGPYRPDEIIGPALPGDIRDVARKAVAYAPELKKIKAKADPALAFWYPYNTLSNFIHLDRLLTGRNRMILDLIGGRPIADIGAGDGDLAFFFETLGVKAHIVDNGPTNFNRLRGARLLKETLQSSVEVHEVDLDAQFRLPDADFGLIFFLNSLYHLKNPYFALEELAKRTTYCLISTRVIQYLPDRRTRVSGGALAYLVDERECNNDSTNFWMFTEKGLRRILARTGWDVLDLITVGATNCSDPASANGDERAYCLVKSRGARAAMGSPGRASVPATAARVLSLPIAIVLLPAVYLALLPTAALDAERSFSCPVDPGSLSGANSDTGCRDAALVAAQISNFPAGNSRRGAAAPSALDEAGQNLTVEDPA